MKETIRQNEQEKQQDVTMKQQKQQHQTHTCTRDTAQPIPKPSRQGHRPTARKQTLERKKPKRKKQRTKLDEKQSANSSNKSKPARRTRPGNAIKTRTINTPTENNTEHHLNTRPAQEKQTVNRHKSIMKDKQNKDNNQSGTCTNTTNTTLSARATTSHTALRHFARTLLMYNL